MSRVVRRIGLIALVALPLAMPSVAVAQYREFAGKVDTVSESELVVYNRRGDKLSFVKVDETVVVGEKTEWGKLKKNDRVTVSWRTTDRSHKAYKVLVMPAKKED